jgi:hypothetical protein
VWVLCKFFTIFCKELECYWILVSAGTQEPLLEEDVQDEMTYCLRITCELFSKYDILGYNNDKSDFKFANVEDSLMFDNKKIKKPEQLIPFIIHDMDCNAYKFLQRNGHIIKFRGWKYKQGWKEKT